MSTAQLLVECAAAGVRVRVEGDVLRLRAPVEPPAEMLAKLKAAKPEIIAYLVEQEERAQAQPPALLPGRCAECGDFDDGSQSIVIALARLKTSWRHARCYSRWIKARGQI